jgi:hypothetical protein
MYCHVDEINEGTKFSPFLMTLKWFSLINTREQEIGRLGFARNLYAKIIYISKHNNP